MCAKYLYTLSIAATVLFDNARHENVARHRKALSEDSSDLEEMKSDVQTRLIMAEINEAAGDDSQADSNLTQASELQETILARSR